MYSISHFSGKSSKNLGNRPKKLGHFPLFWEISQKSGKSSKKVGNWEIPKISTDFGNLTKMFSNDDSYTNLVYQSACDRLKEKVQDERTKYLIKSLMPNYG